jgi:hypothetical protein
VITDAGPGLALRPPQTLPDQLYHHGSHAQLLRSIDASAATPARVDAVIVPTARPAGNLREAMQLAEKLGCPIVALCSKNASAADTVYAARAVEAETIAVDIKPGAVALPRFGTEKVLARTRFASQADISLKRNLGLVLARMAGWERVLFLDDDISGAHAQDVRAAAGLLDDYQAVGLYNLGFPDNSVVCHAFRYVGGAQETFIGGGAMAVAPLETRSFFPNIYNEDWFFMLGDEPPHHMAVTGSVRQRCYDPFANPARAVAEEFGDCLAEGLYWLLDEGQGVEHADTAFWREFLYRRQQFIASILHRLHQSHYGEQCAHVVASLNAARLRSAFITPKLCLDYLHAWRNDLRRWRQYVARLPAGESVDEALSELGLLHRAQRNQRRETFLPAG